MKKQPSKLYILEEFIDSEETLALFKWVDSLNNEPAELIIDSSGGEGAFVSIIVGLLNSNLNIHVSVISFAASSAAEIFLGCNNEKSISVEVTSFMIHITSLNGDVIRAHTNLEGRKYIRKQNERIIKEQIEFFTPLLTKKQMKRFKKFKNVYIGHDQIKSIINQK